MIQYGFNPPRLPCFQEERREDNGIIKVTGSGNLSLKPDMAVISLGVVTEDKTLKDAQMDNAKNSKNVIESLLKEEIEEKYIKTENYSVNPEYDYVDGKQIFRAYKVSNILSVKVKQISKVGEVIDNAVQAGANIVNNLKFTVSNPEIYYNKALSLAVKSAVIKAVEIGKTLNVFLDRTPYKVEEKNYSQPLEQTSAFKYLVASTPIMPGEIKINALIEAFFYYKL